MIRQFSPQANDSLRSAAPCLAKLAEPDCDPAVVAALERILKNQIAALEILLTLSADLPNPN